VTDDLVKRWDEYVESMGSVMGDVERMAQQMRNRIEALTAERDMADRGWKEAIELTRQARLQYSEEKARAEALTADNARLREVLKPFAAKANGYDGIPPAKYWGDTSFVMRYYDDEEVSVTLGNLRKARAALTGKEVMP